MPPLIVTMPSMVMMSIRVVVLPNAFQPPITSIRGANTCDIVNGECISWYSVAFPWGSGQWISCGTLLRHFWAVGSGWVAVRCRTA